MMGTMIRKQIYLEPEQDALLKRLASETGTSEAELIRQAIDRHVRAGRRPRRDLRAWEQERAFIQQLIRQAEAPAPRTWTREDLHDR
jgi:hypothetical protein